MSTDAKEAERARKRRYYWRHRERLKQARVENQDAPAVSAGAVLGVARTYAELVAILKQRRIELDRSQLENDAIAGLQDGYTGKLEIGAVPHGRTMGRISTELWLRGLGVSLLVILDAPPPPPRQATRRRPAKA